MCVVARRLHELPHGGYEPGARVVSLTFDDGPSSTTDAVLDVLAQCEVHATFFVVGDECRKLPEVVARIAERGHAIGAHSWSHTPLGALDDDSVRAEFTRTREIVRTLAGCEVVHARPPYHKEDAARLAALLGPLGWDAVVTWSVDPQDWRRASTPDAIVESVVDALHPGAIVLLHDGGGRRDVTVEALPGLVSAARAQGYRFVTLPQ
jgi:peptidoglycan/xylan/chitin deacetylase (PgdA/CDA1 family)